MVYLFIWFFKSNAPRFPIALEYLIISLSVKKSKDSNKWFKKKKGQLILNVRTYKGLRFNPDDLICTLYGTIHQYNTIKQYNTIQ